MFLRTWNGIDADGNPGSYFGVNSWTNPSLVGANHYYSFDIVNPPVSAVHTGSNQFVFYSSTTAHHGIEIMWPGPALGVRWGDVPVPIQLSSFTWSAAAAGGVRLAWTTVSEINNYGFEVQRSVATPDNFVTLPNSFVPGAGTTLEPREYAWVDETPSGGIAWYRLRQIDLDGTVNLTEAIRVDQLTGVPAEGTPTTYALEQNYPNPFNPSTTIGFSLPKASVVSLKLFTVMGQLVRTLAQQEMAAGVHSVTVEASDLPSGVYYYRLQAGPFVDVKRMTLLK
jgi:hypothetical protein